MGAQVLGCRAPGLGLGFGIYGLGFKDRRLRGSREVHIPSSTQTCL